jgi:hypothetical protein
MNQGRDLPIIQVQGTQIVPLYPTPIKAGSLRPVAPF